MNPVDRDPVRLVSADGARAEVRAFGAHVTSWTTPDGREQLYLSQQAALDGSAAIRGGIPVIFPQFAGEGPLPKHGFARTMAWQLVPGMTGPRAAASEATFELVDSAATRATWPSAFRMRLTVALAPQALELAVTVNNTGRDVLAFTAALHTYLALDDAFAAEVGGLEGLDYRDSITRIPGRQQERVLPVTGAVNRVYRGAPSTIAVRDGVRVVQVEKGGFPDAVVWNPGHEGEAVLGDMASGDARRMLCVEPAVVERPAVLGPGDQWAGWMRLVAS